MLYPVSEIFESIQGEGSHQGIPMSFIRLAGCSVGKRIPEGERQIKSAVLPEYYERCHIWNGTSFICDTDYRVKERLSVDQILERIPNNRIWISLTGGEPLIHDLLPLINALEKRKHPISLETSGTIEFPSYLFNHRVYIRISPKWNLIKGNLILADELKFLVDDSFSEQVIEYLLKDLPSTIKVWLQPVNGVLTVSERNISRCIEILKRHPQWGLSCQLHKFLNVR